MGVRVSTFSPERLPEDPEALAARKDARTTIEAFRSFLKSPAYENNVDLAVLTKIAADESVPVRERRRAAEMLLRFRLKALETLASLEGVREQVLRDLGIATGPQAVSMTQVNQRIEIIRADDWRAAPGLEAIEAEAKVLPEKNEHEVNGHEAKPDG